LADIDLTYTGGTEEPFFLKSAVLCLASSTSLVPSDSRIMTECWLIGAVYELVSYDRAPDIFTEIYLPPRLQDVSIKQSMQPFSLECDPVD
jgi:hypothetical protein